jgi:hypothetical protein
MFLKECNKSHLSEFTPLDLLQNQEPKVQAKDF